MREALLFVALLFGIGIAEALLWIAMCEVYRRYRKAKGIRE